jgi:choice-of-anchor B domain-containing protein
MRKFTWIIASLLTAITVSNSYAHSEHEKSRYVAELGSDSGQCDNASSPCKSIAYAVQQANKGDKVLVASGQYTVSSSSELFYLKSLVVPILGGYNQFDKFENQQPNANPTTLIGIPFDMAAELRNKGFVVITDGKSMKANKALTEKLHAYNQLSKKQLNVACVDGKSGVFECNNIDLQAHIPLNDFSTKPSSANDIWGHVDLNTMKEYALIGLRNGIAVVDVTDPQNPTEVGTVSGLSSVWRDVKVYQYFDEELHLWQAYAYATIDGTSDKVTIIDLNNLPTTVSLVAKNNAVSTAHNVYISNVDPTLNIALPHLTPVLQLIGTNKFGGAFHNYSLEKPETLTSFNNLATGSGYTHDGASMIINDQRATDYCVSKMTPCSIFIDFNEKEMKLWDITNPNKPTKLGTGTYTDVSSSFQYVHSGWPTEDNQYIFLHDEFDEKDAGINSTVRVFSASNLTKPEHIGQWTGSTRAIDHNGFVRGNRYYLSNYERGLTVLDITDPINPIEIGFFDTFTPSNNANYNGAWGAYPFLPSGNILVSDIDSGLYILKDNTLTNSQGVLHFAQQQIQTNRGELITLNVQRSNVTTTPAVTTVNYEIIPGSAKEGSDYIASKGEVSWQANDTDDKQIVIEIAADDTGNELKESFFVRLYNPSNGAALTSPSYIKINIDGQNDTGAISFTQNSVTFAENTKATNISIARKGTSQGIAAVTYEILSNNSAIIGEDVEAQSGQLVWQDGDSTEKQITVNLIDDNTEENTETFLIKLTANSGSRLGAIEQIEVAITDNDQNTAPTVELGNNLNVSANQSITLTATVTDAEGDDISYLWSQTSGTTVSLATPTASSTTFITPATSDTLVFNLTVTDSKGASSTDSVSVSVVAPTPPEEVKPTPKTNSSGGSTNWYIIILLSCCFYKRQHKTQK